jgi:hypothetical protein
MVVISNELWVPTAVLTVGPILIFALTGYEKIVLLPLLGPGGLIAR